MPQVFKVFLSLFIILIGSLVLIGLFTADSDTASARNFHNNVINEIECSNFSDTVINTCQLSAQDHDNYILTINKIADSTGRTITVKVVLTYKYSIPILNVFMDHKLTNYAR